MTQVDKASDKTPLIQKDDDLGPLREKTPKLIYTKRYDQVSWRSADTDFEVDPSASSADELGKVQFANTKKTSRCSAFCTRRNRKLIALAVVVVVFLIIMSGLIYLYYAKSDGDNYTATEPVSTSCGQVTGVVETLTINDDTIETYAFRGIPYGKPPVGSLRWQKSIALTEAPSSCWKNVYEASSFRSSCMQKTKQGSNVGSEDCLFLNIFTSSLSNSKNLPVLVWLHGGNLMHGNGNEYGNSPDNQFSHSMGIVSVTLNYRLNAFGFLSAEELWKDKVSYGNYGFMDQILALKWIKQNVQNFGGNPDDITLAGHGSGGTSVLALLVSPLANTLFHKAIVMSGSAKYDVDYKDAAVMNKEFINKTNCGTVTSAQTSECLRNLTAAEVLRSIPGSWFPQDKYDFPSASEKPAALAVIDPVVVPRSPSDLKNVPFSIKPKIPVIIGSTAQEIGIAPVKNFTYPGSTLDDYKTYLQKKLKGFPAVDLSQILDLYINATSNHSVEYLHETVASDLRLNCPLDLLEHDFLQSKHHFVYRYIVSSTPSSKSSMAGKYAFRGWDSYALFDFKQLRGNGFQPGKEDLRFRDLLRENLKHFIMFGHVIDAEWSAGKIAVIGSEKIKVFEEDYHKQQCKFWNDPNNGFTAYAWQN